MVADRNSGECVIKKDGGRQYILQFPPHEDYRPGKEGTVPGNSPKDDLGREGTGSHSPARWQLSLKQAVQSSFPEKGGVALVLTTKVERKG